MALFQRRIWADNILSEFEEIQEFAEKTAFCLFPELLFRELPLPVFVFFHDFLAHGFGIFAVGIDIVEGLSKEFDRCSSAVPRCLMGLEEFAAFGIDLPLLNRDLSPDFCILVKVSDF